VGAAYTPSFSGALHSPAPTHHAISSLNLGATWLSFRCARAGTGRGRPRQDPTSLATLLRGHG
jgi:hypothetical protein